MFSMKHQNEENGKKRREQFKQRRKGLTKDGEAPKFNGGGSLLEGQPKVRGRAARILEQSNDTGNGRALGRRNNYVSKHQSLKENAKAAEELKDSLKKDDVSPLKRKADEITKDEKEVDGDNVVEGEGKGNDEIEKEDTTSKEADATKDDDIDTSSVFETESQEDEEEKHEVSKAKLAESSNLLKKKIKDAEQAKLNNFAANVEDKVRLHEKGWKVSQA